MPTQQEFEVWISELAAILAGAGVPLGGEVMSLGSGAPSMVCAYLITLINQKMQRIAEDTAVTGMSPAQATVFQNLQDLKRRIEEACDETEEPEEAEPKPEPEPIPDPVDDPGGSLPSGPSVTAPTPKPVATRPPTQQALCCALHGHEPPLIDVSGLRVEYVHGGLTIQGNATVSHPCGIRWYQSQIFVRDARDHEYRIDNRDHRVTRETPEKNVDLNFGGMPLRGFASAWVQVNAESVCGGRAQVIKTPFGVAR